MDVDRRLAKTPFRPCPASFVRPGAGTASGMSTLMTVLAQTAPDDRETGQIIVGIVSIVLGVLILVVPRLLNYIVAAYLIVIGIIWLAAGL